MPWVSRDANSAINGLFANQQPGYADEFLNATDPSVIAYLNHITTPVSVTRRQYYMQGVAAGWFTQAQALALIQLGTLPPSVVNFVASLPANQQFAANMYLIGAATYERNNPLLVALTTAGGISAAFMDSFFIAAALL